MIRCMFPVPLLLVAILSLATSCGTGPAFVFSGGRLYQNAPFARSPAIGDSTGVAVVTESKGEAVAGGDIPATPTTPALKSRGTASVNIGGDAASGAEAKGTFAPGQNESPGANIGPIGQPAPVPPQPQS